MVGRGFVSCRSLVVVFMLAAVFLLHPPVSHALLVDIQRDVANASIINNVINFTLRLDIEPAGDSVSADSAPVTNATLNISGAESKVCTFWVNGTAISGCTNIVLTSITEQNTTSSADPRYASGYGYDPDDPSTVENITETFSSGDGLVHVSGYTMTGGSGPEFQINASWNVSLDTATTGGYSANFEVYTEDGSKNQIFFDNTPVVFGVDLQKPTLVLTYPLNKTYNETFQGIDVNLTFTPTDETSSTLSCNYTLNNVNYTIGSVTSAAAKNVSLSITNNSRANYTTNVWCADGSGNINASKTQYFIVGGVKANITLLQPQNTTYAYPQVDALFKITDDNSSVANCNYTLNSTSYPLGNVTVAVERAFTLPVLNNNTHSLAISCTDADSLEAFSTTRYFTIAYAPSSENITATPSNVSAIQEAQEVSAITQNSSVTFNYTNSSTILVRAITVNATQNASGVRITVQKLDTAPTLTPESEGEVYSYLNIIPINLSDTNISQVVISFEVNKSWYSGNGFLVTDTRLRRFTNNSWDILPTTFTGSGSTVHYFSATSEGFSYYAITIPTQQELSEETTTEQNQTVSANETAQNQTQTNQTVSANETAQNQTQEQQTVQETTPQQNITLPQAPTEESGEMSVITRVLIIVALSILGGGAVVVYVLRDKIFVDLKKPKTPPTPPAVTEIKPPMLPPSQGMPAAKAPPKRITKNVPTLPAKPPRESNTQAYARQLLAYAEHIEKIPAPPQKKQAITVYAAQVRAYAHALLGKPHAQAVRKTEKPELSAKKQREIIRRAEAELAKEEAEIKKHVEMGSNSSEDDLSGEEDVPSDEELAEIEALDEADIQSRISSNLKEEKELLEELSKEKNSPHQKKNQK
ncbi:hypothetical protein COT72_03625 [archaeon CG10_big_fil_rev_8_21_14_0_10_43_11]|nr:MAG: hypothetical protein COT72_03625 [archaeon CG10_big_fil_rev_8_21_14_0_10_43_11]